MSITHTLSLRWAGSNGGGSLQESVTLTGAVENNVDTQIPAGGSISPALDFTLSKLQDVFLVSDQPITYRTNGTQQVNTATVVAASGCTGNGNATVIVTAAGMTGSPLTLAVPLTTALNTAALAANAIREYLAANATIAGFFTVSGTGANIVLTALAAAANDSTMNIATENGTCAGLTTEGSSSATTAGVAPQDTIILSAQEPFVWYAGSGISAPFGGNVSGGQFVCYGSTVANLSVRTLETL